MVEHVPPRGGGAYEMLVINPGSTSTKVAVYAGEDELFREEMVHAQAEVGCRALDAQMPMREAAVRGALEKRGYDLRRLDGVVGRGGLIPGLDMGGYRVNEAMCQVIRSGKLVSHASNLGALLAEAVAAPLGIPAVIYDAVGADSMMDIARITGMPEIHRQSFCHVLNSRAMGREYAKSLGREYADLRLLVAHLGGGISISAHLDGKIIDVVSDDGGPFSPERAGSLPIHYIIDMCFDKGYTKEEVLCKQRGNGGLKALLGTSDCREVERRIAAGDEYAALCYRAQAYQIAKGIGNLAPALSCRMDAILLTGGLAHSELLTGMVKDYVEPLAPVVVMPGENEMRALALGLLRILQGQERAQEYQPKK